LAWGASSLYYDYLGPAATPGTVSGGPINTITFSDAIQAVSAGASLSGVLKGDGTVWCWGDNEDGQFGNGTYASGTTPGSPNPTSALKPDMSGPLSGADTVGDGLTLSSKDTDGDGLPDWLELM